MKEPDGTSYEGWGPVGVTIRGNVQPAGGRVMAEMYGERLGYMLTMYNEKSPEALQLLNEFNGEKKGFGAWVYISNDRPEPDYKVASVRPWGAHIVIDLEADRS
ncbi:hypothetical protein P4H50_07485 [Paenibacillus apiarius]|nr:hypothetical protein [Paenibacillus apiarius]MEC0118796.1 hypothetical protein [Paenibacillus apiarius]